VLCDGEHDEAEERAEEEVVEAIATRALPNPPPALPPGDAVAVASRSSARSMRR
jgi:hypothetical protein